MVDLPLTSHRYCNRVHKAQDISGEATCPPGAWRPCAACDDPETLLPLYLASLPPHKHHPTTRPRTLAQLRLPPPPSHLRLRVLPDLQAKPEVEVGRLPDGAIAVRANVIADDPVVAYCQSAAGKVLKCDG